MNKKIGREAMILKKRRKEMGMTQTDVAGQVGIQLQQYQLYAPWSAALCCAGTGSL